MKRLASRALPQDISDFALALPRLSAEQEKTATRDQLVLHNLWIARWGAIRLQKRTAIWRADHWDVFQEGVLGLFRATETWESDRGIRFSTYAINWVMQKQRRFLKQHSLVRIPDYQIRSDPDGWSEKARRAFGIISEADADDGRSPIFEAVAAPQKEPAFGFDEIERLRKAWGEVPRRERAVLLRRTALGETLEAAGGALGVSRERARQIEGSAKRSLEKSYRRLSVAGAR